MNVVGVASDNFVSGLQLASNNPLTISRGGKQIDQKIKEPIQRQSSAQFLIAKGRLCDCEEHRYLIEARRLKAYQYQIGSREHNRYGWEYPWLIEQDFSLGPEGFIVQFIQRQVVCIVDCCRVVVVQECIFVNGIGSHFSFY